MKSNLVADAAGLLRSEDRSPVAKPADSFVIGESHTAEDTYVIFRLAWSEDQNMKEGSEVHSSDAHQFVMTPKRARAFAEAMIEMLDQAEEAEGQHRLIQ